MPNITVPIINTYDSITRPVSVMLAKEIMRICMISDDTPLYLPGERGVTNQPGSEFGSSDSIRYESHNRVICNVEEKVRNNQLLATSIRANNDSAPVIQDADLGLVIKPVYVQHDLTFNFRYVAETLHGAERWKSAVMTRIAESRSALQHTLLYDLTFNDDLLALLSEVYNKREAVAGYGQPFSEWFNAIQIREIVAKGTIDGDLSKLVLQIPERQAHLTGFFEPGDVPVERRVDDNTTYEIEFTYKVSYMKPVHWNVVYPLMIHQQHIDPMYVDMTPRVSIDDLDTRLSNVSWQAFERITWRDRDRSKQPVGGLRHPYYDEWFKPDDHVPWSIPAMTWLLAIGVEDRTLLLDLNDLPDMVFSPNTLNYLLAVRESLTTPNRALVRFTLYDGDSPLDGSSIYVDEHLCIRSHRPLSLRRVYRLRLSITTSTVNIPPHVLTKASEYPLATLEILQTLLPSLDVEWALINAVSEDVLDTDYIEWVLSITENRRVGANGAPTLNRKVFVNPVPEVRVTVERHWNDKGPQPVGPVDPGVYSGINAPISAEMTTPIHELDEEFEFETEEDFQEKLREYRQGTARPMNPDGYGNIPLINNRRDMVTVQYLALFTRKR